MKKRHLVRAIAAGALSLAAVALPASVASARPVRGPTVWVNNGAAVGTDSSCTSPGFSTIQSAIDVAELESGTVEVCSSATPYTEQLTITGNVSLVAVGAVAIDLPAAPVNSTTSCDLAVGGTQQDEVSICGASASLTGAFTISSFFPDEGCAPGLFGIFVGQGGSLTAAPAPTGGAGLAISGAGVALGSPDTGCQQGVAIEVGSWSSTPGQSQSASASITKANISGYQKSGIVAQAAGTTLSVTSSTITGRGDALANNTAENGIEVDLGAKGTLTKDTVSADECDPNAGVQCGPNLFEDYWGSGVLFYQPAAGSTLTKSTITDNDVGVYYGSGAATAPASPEVALSTNTLTGNRWGGLVLDQGSLSSSHDTINGTGAVGIAIFQYASQTFGSVDFASHDKIVGQTTAISVLSDEAPGDFPGSLTISSSKFASGNTNLITNNSPGGNFVISGPHDH